MQFTILGQPVSMKNRRRLVKNRYTGKTMFIKSKEALDYEKSFIAQMYGKVKHCIDIPVRVDIIAYYTSNRPDLDCELIYDCLQKSCVIKNDRLIVIKYAEKRIDKNIPRCEISIRVLY